MREYSIGIDFGTTKTLVAYLPQTDNKPEIAHLGRERYHVPSTVYISEDGIWEFGDDADDYAAESSGIYFRDFKLQLGSQASLGGLTSKGVVSHTARELTAKFLKYIRTRCETEVFNGNRVTCATITHPATFSPAQLDDLRRAAEDAGFSDIHLLSEPEAAGLAFCRLSMEDVFEGSALVVDWGGGTLDLAIVSRDSKGVKVQRDYTDGYNTLGGIFFDDLLWKDACKRLLGEGARDTFISEPAHIRQMQRKRVKAAKERLSRQSNVQLVLTGSSGAYPAMTYTRAELEKVLSDSIKAGVDGVVSLIARIKEASLHPQQIILIGGSSRIPCIGNSLKEATGLPCRLWQYSMEAVALGAALAYNAGLPSPNETAEAADDKLDTHSPDDLLNLGDSYYSGAGHAQNYVRAVEYYRRAAEMGNVKAQAMLASCYWDGKGVTQSYKDAAKWYERAARSGNVKACYKLALCYENGLGGLVKSDIEAIKWYIKAAEQGIAGASSSPDGLEDCRPMNDRYARKDAVSQASSSVKSVVPAIPSVDKVAPPKLSNSKPKVVSLIKKSMVSYAPSSVKNATPPKSAQKACAGNHNGESESSFWCCILIVILGVALFSLVLPSPAIIGPTFFCLLGCVIRHLRKKRKS